MTTVDRLGRWQLRLERGAGFVLFGALGGIALMAWVDSRSQWSHGDAGHFVLGAVVGCCAWLVIRRLIPRLQ